MRPCGWDKPIRLNKETRKDLLFWKNLINSSYNEISFDFYLKPRDKGDIHIWTDAAIKESTGIGGYCSNGYYFQASWNKIKQQWPWPINDISGPELLALVVLTTALAKHCKNKSIILHCDNSSVVSMIIHEKCNARKASHMALIRYFITTMFENRIKFFINHIPGVHNTEADKLSRFKPKPFERLYKMQRPYDQHTAPFFEINPTFPHLFKFNKLNLTNHTINCIKYASIQVPTLQDLDKLTTKLLEGSITSSTNNTYNYGIHLYQDFCDYYNLSPIPQSPEQRYYQLTRYGTYRLMCANGTEKSLNTDLNAIQQ